MEWIVIETQEIIIEKKARIIAFAFVIIEKKGIVSPETGSSRIIEEKTIQPQEK